MGKAELQRRYEQAVEERLALAAEAAQYKATAEWQGQLVAELRDQLRVERERSERLQKDLHRYAGIDETPVTGRSAYSTEDDEIRRSKESAAAAAAAQAEAELVARGLPGVL